MSNWSKKMTVVFAIVVLGLGGLFPIVGRAWQLPDSPEDGVLAACNGTRTNLCVNSFGRLEGESFVALQSFLVDAGPLTLSVNGQPYACETSTFDAAYLYCSGPKLPQDTLVQLMAYIDGELIASGRVSTSLDVPRQNSPAPSFLGQFIVFLGAIYNNYSSLYPYIIYP